MRSHVVHPTTAGSVDDGKSTVAKEIQYVLDVNTLHRIDDAQQLGLNEVGRVRLRTTQPAFCAPSRRTRNTAGFVLVDESTNQTVGAGKEN